MKATIRSLGSFTLAVLGAQAATLPDGSFEGDGTYYGGSGVGGACTQTYVPPGFKTVAMNNEQYADGRACGGCLEGCIDNMETGRVCFKAIVDNKCPECLQGSLDMGENGSGRWHVGWRWITCPDAPLLFTTQGSNSWYGKLKVEGGGRVASIQCNGMEGTLTSDAYFTFSDGSGSLGCGPTCTVNFFSGRRAVGRVQGSMFGNQCNSGAPYNGPNPSYSGGVSPVPAPAPVPAPVPQVTPVPQTKPAPAPGPNVCAKLDGQCGGLHFVGPKCCGAGLSCVVRNEWFSKCMQVSAPCSKLYGQCGGSGWGGATCCEAGSVCVATNQYYSQCAPAPAAPKCAQDTTQCGGKLWKGPTGCCNPKSKCTWRNDYYSKCMATMSTAADLKTFSAGDTMWDGYTLSGQNAPNGPSLLGQVFTNNANVPVIDINATCQGERKQCGGLNHTGPRTCCAGTCVYENSYYSECTPPPAIVIKEGGVTDAPGKDGTLPTCALVGDKCNGSGYTEETTCCDPSAACLPVSDSTSLCSFPAIAPDFNIGCSAPWSQCGGKEYEGPSCCTGGAICTRLSVWYSQCLLPSPEGICAKEQGQCGGKDHTSPTCCYPHTLTCVPLNEDFSQCQSL